MTNALARQIRTRKHLRQATRPRLSVFRSNQHIWAQVIDDARGVTLASANDLQIKGSKTVKATEVGTVIAKLALTAKCPTVVFDRGGYRYHGRVKALAEAARQAGLVF